MHFRRDKLLMENSNPVWVADLGNGFYKNPVLHADYSDPDVVRVGDDFYMVASSFQMSPCLPVLHSTDLINWTLINHVAERLPFSSYDAQRHGDGVWAPSIKYHDNKFWVFFATPDEGVFMSTAEDPAKEWSPLHLVKEVKGWIDPCPFWDDDGRAYLVNAFAKSRIGFKSILHMSRMKADGTALLDEGQRIFDGNLNHETIEGPKMYKRNGYYYIFAPAGGVATGWQTILRSKSVFGPYKDKIVLHQGATTINGPHQGGWVELESGESWFLHFQDKGAYGRIVHLQPMEWTEDDWPLMGTNQDENGLGEPVLTWKKPNVSIPTTEVIVPATSDDFQGNQLGLQWQWRANLDKQWYSLENQCLRLFAVSQPKNVNTIFDTANVLTQKFPAEEFTVTTAFQFHPDQVGDQCGLTILGFSTASIVVSKQQGRFEISYLRDGIDEKQTKTVITEIETNRLFFRIEVKEGAKCSFSYSVNGTDFILIKDEFQTTVGRWIGAQVGIFCLNAEQKSSAGYTDFQSFAVHL